METMGIFYLFADQVWGTSYDEKTVQQKAKERPYMIYFFAEHQDIVNSL